MDVEKIRNKIITISGEPVSGKGATVKALVEKLKQRGYKEENIHVITTGHKFRNYFNTILEECISNPEFISNLDNEEKLNELAKTEEIKIILSNPEYKKEFIKEIEIFKLKMQEPKCRTELIERLRKQHKVSKKLPGNTLTIEEANNMPELNGIRGLVDKVIDENTEKIGKEINKENRPDEIWIIDSRLAFNKIKDSFSVRLTCRPDIAGKRLFEDKSRGKEDSGYKNVEAAIEEREKRKNGEIKRYKERCDGLDLTNEDNYKLIIDTSFATIDDISDTILICLDRYSAGKEFAKNWGSPKTFLATQIIGQTFNGYINNKGECIQYSLKEWEQILKKQSYDPNCPILIKEKKGLKFIWNGHHRNFAMARLGKTLIPYIKEEGLINTRNLISHVYDHEEAIKKVDPSFKYINEIYPDLVDKIQEVIEEVSKELDKKDKEDRESI